MQIFLFLKRTFSKSVNFCFFLKYKPANRICLTINVLGIDWWEKKTTNAHLTH